MTPTAIVVAAVVLVFAVVPHRRRAYRSRARRALLLCCAALDGALAVQLPIVHDTLNHVARFNLAWPVQHGLVLVAAWACQAFLVLGVENDPARAARRLFWRAGPMCMALTVMTILFGCDPNAAAFRFGPDGRLDQQPPESPVAAVAFAVFALYLCYSSLLTTSGFWRWGRKAAGMPELRAGLCTTAMGCALTALYAVHVLLVQAIVLAGHSVPWHVADVENQLIPLAAAISLTGLCAPTFRSGWIALAGYIKSYLVRRQIYPLWNRVYDALPGIAFTPPRCYLHDWFRLRRSRTVLYRMVIELWDARNALRPLVPCDDLAAAAHLARESGLDDHAVHVTVEAIGIVGGLRARKDNVRGSPAQCLLERPPGCDTLEASANWWRDVARCIDSPYLRDILERIPAR